MFSLESIHPIIASGGINAPDIPAMGWITNSILVAVLVTSAVLAFTRMATKRMELIPGAKQNFVEYIVEFLYVQVEGIVGKHVAPKAFPLLATFFIFILVSNWFGLIPGVGTIGFGHEGPACPRIDGDTAASPGDGGSEHDAGARHGLYVCLDLAFHC